jgi:AhpD family alkylhydroperoxidase
MEMTSYAKHTIETAPEGSRPAMQRLKESAGLIPNLAATMSGAPALIDGFVTLREVLQRATLDAKEREILGLSNAVANGCEWCVAFHSFVALKLGISRETVDAIRAGKAPVDPRARALNAFTGKLIECRGAIEKDDLEAFVGGGFTPQQALEVVAALAVSLMANYAGNFVEPELDAFLGEFEWSRH